jgi:LacI family transcriptional regulator
MRGASFTIGFEVPHLGNDFFTQVTEGAASTLSGSGYQLIVAPGLGYLSGTSVLDALVDRQVDGVIAVSSDVDAQWLEQLATHIPVVLLGRHVVSQNYDTVTDNDDRGTDLVIDHLLELGHRRITHLTIDPPTAVAPQAVRLAAYRRRMEALGREPRVVFTGPSEQEAFESTLMLLEAGNRPSAIFAGNDTLAIGVLRAVAECGLTAQEVSVAGYDNINLARHPLISLTTVDQFGATMGQTAVDLLMERIRDGRTTPKHHQTEPELRIRNSTRTAKLNGGTSGQLSSRD